VSGQELPHNEYTMLLVQVGVVTEGMGVVGGGVVTSVVVPRYV